MKKKWIAALLAAVLLVVPLAGCGQQAASSSASASSSDSSATVAEITKTDLTVAMSQDLTTWDPIGSSAMQDQILYRLVYARLFATDSSMQTYPELAESYEQVSDTEYKFTIYKGAKFSDGSEIKAEDVAYSLERAHQSAAFATLMATVDTIEATGEYEITITTTGPSPALYQALAHPGTGILPKSYLEQADATGDFSDPITSGRYLIDSREIGVSTKIVKNDNYFDPENAAENTSLTFLYVPENSTRTVLVQTGEADISTSVASSDYSVVKSDPNVTLYEAAGTTVQYLGFDTTQAPFNDPLVRQAVAYAVDRTGILTIVADDLGTVTYTVLPPTTLGYTEANPAGFSYDVDKAKELLAQAGYPNGFDTTIVVFSDTAENVATVAQSYLSQVGINATIERYDTSVRMDMFANHKCPMFAAQWGALADAELVLPRLFTEGATYNWSYFHDDKVDSLLQQAREESDNDARAELYGEAVAIIDESAAWVPVYIPNVFVLANSQLQGVQLDGEGVINLYDLHY